MSEPRSNKVRIVDVAPRDGLQNDTADLAVEEKVQLIAHLRAAGVEGVEIGSFVHPKRVPKMADTDAVARAVCMISADGVTGLVPNPRGYERAAAAGLKHVRVVVAVSDAMNRANFGMGPGESIAGIEAIVRGARADGVSVGGAVATAFGCPYEGRVDEGVVLDTVRRFVDLGLDEVVLADTTGMAVPTQVRRLAAQALRAVEGSGTSVGVHLHNTRNTGYACAFAAYEAGVRLFDASLGESEDAPSLRKQLGTSRPRTS